MPKCIERLHHARHSSHTPQHAATRCNTLQYTATRCNMLQHTVPGEACKECLRGDIMLFIPVIPYNTLYHSLQHIATHCNTLQHIATHCTRSSMPGAIDRRHHTRVSSHILQHTATHCNTLQHATTHCNTLCLEKHAIRN